MNTDDWNQLTERSRVLVHHVSRLLGVLTHPTQSHDEFVHAPIAAEAAVALDSLVEQMSAAPELAAHLRTIQRFEIALAAWRRSVAEASPLAMRYQRALLQHVLVGALVRQIIDDGAHLAQLQELQVLVDVVQHGGCSSS